MADILRFVDALTGSANLRLDLNDGAKWAVKYDGTDFSPPGLKASYAGTLLVDGETLTASAYENRRIQLHLELIGSSVDDVAAELQKLHRELDRPVNFLKWQPDGMTHPVFFRTLRSAGNRIRDYPGPGLLRTVEVAAEAEPFAYGIAELLTPVTVYADPADAQDLNLNPYFETNAANWTGSGGAIVRSTAQFHEGAASLLLTPDGVTANSRATNDQVTGVLAGTSYRASAWVRCAVARNINLQVLWADAGGGALSTSTTTVAVSATTWTWIDVTLTAPASSARATLRVEMTGTPPGSNTLHIDEARFRSIGGAGACYTQVVPKGDVPTPLHIAVSPNIAATGRNTSAIAVRRRGTPGSQPFLLQAEAMTPQSADTTIQNNDTAMSGSGQNFMRCTFATTAAMVNRLALFPFPAVTSVDTRGTYRVLVRYRKSVAGDPVQMRWQANLDGATYTGETVTLPSTTGPNYVDLSGTDSLLQFPMGVDPVTHGIEGTVLKVQGVNFLLQAARLSGTTNLDIDAVLFVAADDRLAFVKWGQYSGGYAYQIDGQRVMAYHLGLPGDMRPNDLIEVTGLPPQVTPGVENRIWFIRNVGSTVTDSISATTTLTLHYWPQYLHVRPVST